MATLAIALAAVATVPAAGAARRSPTASAQATLRAKLAKQKAPTQAQALWTGVAKTGPKHTLDAVKAKPGRYVLMLGGLAAAGAGMEAIGVDPEPYAIGLSVLIYGWSSVKSLPGILAAKGARRMEKIGAELLWPLALVAGTTAAGKLFGHAKVEGHHAKTAGDLARAGAQTVVFTIDAPTIVQSALGGSHAKAKKKPSKRATQARRKRG